MRQFTLLFANAWRRFARADGLARGADPHATLLLAAIALAAPGVMVAFFLSIPVLVGKNMRFIDPGPSLNLLALYSGLLVALVTLLQWDSLLPNAADAAMLAPLPVAPRRLVAAHGAALAALLAGLAFVVNVPYLLLIPLLDSPPGGHFAPIFRLMLTQAAGVVVTGCLAFGSLVALQSLLLVCLGPRGLRTLGAALQFVGIVAVLTALLLVPVLLELGMLWLGVVAPPLRLAKWAAVAAIAAGVLYVPAAHSALRPVRALRARRAGLGGLWGWGRAPRIAAVARFTALTLVRCRRQRVVVGIWLAAGAAVVIADSMGAALAVPLVLALFLLTGLRHSFAVPVDLRANWLFRLSVDDTAQPWLEGGRHLMGVCVALLLIPAAGLAAWLGPARLVPGQVLFVALFGALAIQCLTWSLRKIPFTCSYRPGDMNLKYVWPFYALGFSLGGWVLASCEQWMLGIWWRAAAGIAVLAALLVWTERERRRSLVGAECIFEDEPEPVVRTLFEN